MFYASVVFAVLFAIVRVQVGKAACGKVFETKNLKKICCEIDPASIGVTNNTNANNNDVDNCGLSGMTTWTCAMSTCILTEGRLMKNGKIDYKASNDSLEALVQNYPQTKAMADSVLKHCAEGKYEDKMPSYMCLATKFQACYFLGFAKACPKWSQDADCQELAGNVAKCSQLFD